MDALCKWMFIIIETNHSQQSMKTIHVSKVIGVFQRPCSCLLDTWNMFKLLLFVCTEQFTDTNLFTFLQDRAAHFFWTCKMYIYYLLLDLFASLCHIEGWWPRCQLILTDVGSVSDWLVMSWRLAWLIWWWLSFISWSLCGWYCLHCHFHFHTEQRQRSEILVLLMVNV